MPATQVGTLLRDRREELGISLNRAASATNIRAKVLETIEDNDFAQYPPYGHAMGMLSSYARFLELDPRVVLQLFESNYSTFKASENESRTPGAVPRHKSRTGSTVGSQQSGPMTRGQSAHADPSSTGSLSSGMGSDTAEGDNRYVTGNVRVVGHRQTNRFSRVRRNAGNQNSTRSEMGSAPGSDSPSYRFHTSREQRAQESRSSRRGSRQSKRPAAKKQSALVPGYDDTELSFFTGAEPAEGSSKQKRRRSRRKPIEKSETHEAPKSLVERVTGRLSEIFAERRVRIIAIIIVVFVVAVSVIAATLISTAGSNDSDDIIPVEGGAADTTETKTDPKKATATVTTTNGNPISVKIAVAENSTSLINVIYDDDHAYNGTAVGPWKQEFLVTESLSASFGNPDAVAVTQNGNEVPIEKLEDGTGRLTIMIETSSTGDS